MNWGDSSVERIVSRRVSKKRPLLIFDVLDLFYEFFEDFSAHLVVSLFESFAVSGCFE
jgi:hypothetical protein